jgi:hypothetical protein
MPLLATQWPVPFGQILAFFFLAPFHSKLSHVLEKGDPADFCPTRQFLGDLTSQAKDQECPL